VIRGFARSGQLDLSLSRTRTHSLTLTLTLTHALPFQDDLAEASTKLAEVQAHVADLESKLAVLVAEYDKVPLMLRDGRVGGNEC
jgi:hypothetical protein